ncbi:sigma factor [Sinomonas atrocyanea]
MSESAVMESRSPLTVLAGGLAGEPAAGRAPQDAAREGAAREGAAGGPEDAAHGGAAGALVVEHLGLADALARRYRVPGHDFEDIRQVARMGLVMAAQRYREGAGHGFVQFAVPTIAGTIKRYLRDQSWVVRPPRSLQELRLGVKEARGRLVQELGREPSLAELGEAIGASPEQVAEARSVDAAMSPAAIESLDDSSGEGEGSARRTWCRWSRRGSSRWSCARWSRARWRVRASRTGCW